MEKIYSLKFKALFYKDWAENFVQLFNLYLRYVWNIEMSLNSACTWRIVGVVILLSELL